MEMSPVICKQVKEGLKGSRREKKGERTVRSNGREGAKFQESESGVGDPFRPRVQLARGVGDARSCEREKR